MIIIVGLWFVYFFCYYFFKDPFWNILEWIPSILGFPLLVFLLLTIIALFSLRGHKNAQSDRSAFKKAIEFIFRLILVTIMAIVSLIVLFFIIFITGIFPSPTYGTPIYRPRIKL